MRAADEFSRGSIPRGDVRHAHNCRTRLRTQLSILSDPDRLQGEPADGVADLPTQPIEPRAMRLTLSKTF